jgi:hypothetical protein
MAQFARATINRRNWLQAGFAVVVFAAPAAIATPALNVTFDGDDLHVAAPQFHFLTGKPLERLKDGATVVFLSQLTLRDDRGFEFRRAPERLTISYDVWEEKFKVVMSVDNHSVSGLSLAAAETWCLDNLAISTLGMEPTRPFALYLDMRVATERDLATLMGDRGISMRNWIEFFSRKPGADLPFHLEAGPFRLADLPRTFAHRTHG